MMTSQQLTALKHHCRFAFETLHPRFCRMVRHGASVIVTVNSGYE
jgi:hypothetical protein